MADIQLYHTLDKIVELLGGQHKVIADVLNTRTRVYLIDMGDFYYRFKYYENLNFIEVSKLDDTNKSVRLTDQELKMFDSVGYIRLSDLHKDQNIRDWFWNKE